MVILTKSSSAPGTALFYITAGSLMTIWAAVWFFAFQPENRVAVGLCAGLFLTGLAFLVIGFGVGRIGRRRSRRTSNRNPHPRRRARNPQTIQTK